MRFMTQGTLQNLPAYLAEDRARRAGQAAEERERREREEREKLQRRMRDLGQKFLQGSDFSPQALQSFAQDNEMSQPEMKSLVDMVVGFKQLQTPEPELVPARRPDGVEVYQPKVAGLESHPVQKEPGNIWGRDAQGNEIRVPDQPGVMRAPLPGQSSGPEEMSTKVPEYMKIAHTVLGKSLGFTDTGGWPNPEAQEAYDQIMNETSARMRGKPGEEVYSVLFDVKAQHDTQAKVEQAMKRIPKAGMLTSISTATTLANQAIGAGASITEVEEDLKAKGWSDSDVKKILKGTSAPATSTGSDPLSLGDMI